MNNIIFSDKNIVVAEKPQKIPCQPDRTGDKDFLTTLCENNPPFKELFLVHRLDRPVGGIMVFAKNKKACSFLSEQIKNGSFKKNYLAVVCGVPAKDEDCLKDYIVKNQRLNMSKLVSKNTSGSKYAELSYKLIDTAETDEYGKLSLLDVSLKTGRHHQIRLQLSHIGIPIWGDKKYNSFFKRGGIYTETALFSSSVEFINPTTEKKEKYTLFPNDIFPFTLFKNNL